MTIRRSYDCWPTAIHEAGHVAIILALGKLFTSVTIKPDRYAYGAVPRRGVYYDDVCLADAYDEMFISLSGPIAEYLSLRRSARWFNDAVWLELKNSPEYRLFKQLSGRDFNDDDLRSAFRLVGAHREEITMLARVLYQSETLSYHRVKQILERYEAGTFTPRLEGGESSVTRREQ